MSDKMRVSKIERIRLRKDGTSRANIFIEGEASGILVSKSWLKSNKPEVDGFYVEAECGAYYSDVDPALSVPEKEQEVIIEKPELSSEEVADLFCDNVVKPQEEASNGDLVDRMILDAKESLKEKEQAKAPAPVVKKKRARKAKKSVKK